MLGEQDNLIKKNLELFHPSTQGKKRYIYIERKPGGSTIFIADRHATCKLNMQKFAPNSEA